MSLSHGGILVHEIVSFLINNEEDNNNSIHEILELRLVCKDWNELFINSHEYFYTIMINHLEKSMKSRGLDENIHHYLSKIPSSNFTMLKCLRNCQLAQQSIKCLNTFISEYDQESYVEPAILNERNDELVSEMIDQITPFIFVKNVNSSFMPYDQSEFEYEFIISNVHGNDNVDEESTKLNYSLYRCDYPGGNGDLLRSLIITFQENEILNIDVCYSDYSNNNNSNSQSSTNKIDEEMIKVIMKRIGLKEEMINSKACLDEFLLAIYWKAVVGIINYALCERDLFVV